MSGAQPHDKTEHGGRKIVNRSSGPDQVIRVKSQGRRRSQEKSGWSRRTTTQAKHESRIVVGFAHAAAAGRAIETRRGFKVEDVQPGAQLRGSARVLLQIAGSDEARRST
jgi:hypothetical protein